MAADEDAGGEEPCFAHRIVAGKPVDPDTWRDVNRFRRAERERLYALRRRLSVEEGRRQAAAIGEALGGMVGPSPGLAISAYWPIRGEPDLRGWMERADRAGAAVLLPVVVEPGAPLAFRRWRPGCRMERGVWNIPVPSEGEWMTPDIALAPLVGIDRLGFRLGNGGGYFDRTLAAFGTLPRRIGVGHDFCRIESIFPMHWDVPMTDAAFGDGTTSTFPPA